VLSDAAMPVPGSMHDLGVTHRLRPCLARLCLDDDRAVVEELIGDTPAEAGVVGSQTWGPSQGATGVPW
jgi:hypothetical protein